MKLLVPIAWKQDWQSPKRLRSPATRMTRVPSWACVFDPWTCASRYLPPLREIASAMSWLVSESMPVISTYPLVVLISCRTPQLPNTRSFAAWGSETQEKVMSASAITSLGVSASLAPASTKSRTFSTVLFHTVTVWPELSRFFTMPEPMMPRPRNPKFSLLGWMSFSLSIWLLVTRSIPTAGDTGLARPGRSSRPATDFLAEEVGGREGASTPSPSLCVLLGSSLARSFSCGLPTLAFLAPALVLLGPEAELSESSPPSPPSPLPPPSLLSRLGGGGGPGDESIEI